MFVRCKKSRSVLHVETWISFLRGIIVENILKSGKFRIQTTSVPRNVLYRCSVLTRQYVVGDLVSFLTPKELETKGIGLQENERSQAQPRCQEHQTGPSCHRHQSEAKEGQDPRNSAGGAGHHLGDGAVPVNLVNLICKGLELPDVFLKFQFHLRKCFRKLLHVLQLTLEPVLVFLGHVCCEGIESITQCVCISSVTGIEGQRERV